MNRVKNILNNKKYIWIIVFILFAPFMYSMNFPSGSIELLDDFFTLSRVASCFILTFLFFVVEKKKPSKLLILLFILEAYQLLVTCFTNKKIVVAIYDLTSCLAIALLIELFLGEPKELLKGMILHYELALYPNLVTLLLYMGRTGRYGDGFFYLGDYTILIEFFIPAIAVAFLYMKLTNNKVRCIPLIVVAIVSSFICYCSTAIMAMLVVVCVFAYGTIFKKEKNVSISAFFVLVLLADIFLVFIYAGGMLPMLDSFIENVLHRSITFTGRTYIWARDVEMIKESPLFGYGYRTIVYYNGGTQAGTGHNMLLDKCIVGGIPEMIIFLLMHVDLFMKAEKYKPSISKLVLVSLMVGTFMTYITEAYFKFWRFYVVFFLLYHLDEVLKEQKDGQKAI